MSFLVKCFFLEFYPEVNVDSLGQCTVLWELSRQAVKLQGWLRAEEATNPALGQEAHQKVVLAVILQENQRIQVLLHLKQKEKTTAHACCNGVCCYILWCTQMF